MLLPFFTPRETLLHSSALLGVRADTASGMCTLIALHRQVPGARLVVAANRDEYFDRPSEGLALRANGAGCIVSPLDVRAGGTWLGLNSRGVFAAVTNRRTQRADPSRKSRGELVTRALEAATAREAADRVEAQFEGAGFNPFNFFVSDGDRAFALSLGDGEARPGFSELAPGAHVIGNVALAGEPSPKLDALRARVGPAARRAAADVLGELRELCRHHDDSDTLAGTCVHTPTYGTRSSLLLRLGAAGSELRYSEGAPCRAPYRDFTPLLHTLFESDRRAEGGNPRGARA
jgi:uncharacterized protein with NRDE domain